MHLWQGQATTRETATRPDSSPCGTQAVEAVRQHPLSSLCGQYDYCIYYYFSYTKATTGAILPYHPCPAGAHEGPLKSAPALSRPSFSFFPFSFASSGRCSQSSAPESRTNQEKGQGRKAKQGSYAAYSLHSRPAQGKPLVRPINGGPSGREAYFEAREIVCSALRYMYVHILHVVIYVEYVSPFLYDSL